MSRWHRHEWDLLPENAFRPVAGRMTLEGGGGKGGGGSQVVGYWYSFGIHMGICRGPVDEVLAIRVGDKPAWSGSITTSAALNIDNANLFGGVKGEGGIAGTGFMSFGESTAVAHPPLVSMTGLPQPGFRGMLTYFFDGYVTALNPYPKPWKFRVRRTTSGWQTGTLPSWGLTYGKIIMTPSDAGSLGSGWGNTDIHAMNPALIIYECLTNGEWGRGLHPNAIDGASFEVAAQKLFSEGFGLCLKWSRKDTIQAFIQSILDHIVGVVYTDRSTGKIKLKLIRDDYVVSTLPLFTPDTGLMSIDGNATIGSGSLINEIHVKYRHGVTGETRTVRTDSLGAIKGNAGGKNASTRNYPGIPTAELALRVAERDLRSVAIYLRKFTFTLDRRGRNVYPGDAIRIADPAMGVTETVVRVGKIEDSYEQGRVKITAVQDIFGLPSESYGGSVGQSWTPPDNKPCLSYRKVFEAPYFLVARYATAADFDYLDVTSAGICTVCNEGKSLNGAYDLAVKLGAIDSSENPPDGSYNCPI